MPATTRRPRQTNKKTADAANEDDFGFGFGDDVVSEAEPKAEKTPAKKLSRGRKKPAADEGAAQDAEAALPVGEGVEKKPRRRRTKPASADLDDLTFGDETDEPAVRGGKSKGEKPKKTRKRSSSKREAETTAGDGVTFDDPAEDKPKKKSDKKDKPRSAKKDGAAKKERKPRKSKSPKEGPVEFFADLDLSDRRLEVLDELGYEKPTPVQAQTLPIALSGRDVIGQAPTGTGKTCAFMLPILENLDPDARGVQAVILSPTRELAEQVAAEGERLAGRSRKKSGGKKSDGKKPGGAKIASIVGGRPMGPQRTALEKGAQIVVGTPGRVLDLIGRGVLLLGDVRFAVLDEADRMLDFGFRPDIEKILSKCPKDRQTLLFSATMPAEVMKLVDRYQQSPEVVDLSEKSTSEQVEQYLCSVDQDRKFGTLCNLLAKEKPRQCIVFCRTKRGADKIGARLLKKLPHVDVLHGDLKQSQRDKVMKRFRAGKTRLLIATDIVGRGIDVSYVSHIVNYDVPEDCDDYVHRVGRTGRLSSKTTGKAFTFATRADGNELNRIENRINKLLEPYDFGIGSMRERDKEVRVWDDGPKVADVPDDFGTI